eukprot:TRINITY_DN1206_c0_g1_i1.p1 TRINITY_DN1206_c0_g1~~TRINITY_DN1206_c0_g1_i1.p1  ORF type:complete len:292 (-),score=55.64 TRINITY_DN1206_c0_g1_i1:57-932(-)
MRRSACILLVLGLLSAICGANRCAGDLLDMISTPFKDLDDAFDRMSCMNAYFYAHNDRRAEFLTVYTQTTYQMRKHIRETNWFHNRTWTEAYSTIFADIYRSAVYNWEIGNLDNVPEAWDIAFTHAEKGDLLILQNIALGINAHINHDLAYAVNLSGIAVDTHEKWEDHTTVNDVILVVYNLLELPLLGVYAPAFPFEVKDFNFLITGSISAVVNTTRELAWSNAVCMQANAGDEFVLDALDETISGLSVVDAEVIIHGLDLLGPICYDMQELEGPNPLSTYCNVVPWGCT